MDFRLTSPLTTFSGEFSPLLGLRALLDARWADLSRPVQKTLSHYPQIGERKQSKELLRVFHQTPVVHLPMNEPALDHSKRILDLGTDTRLGALEIIQ